MVRKYAIAGILVFLPSAVHGEPDALIRQLMAAPVSRLEHGLFKLETHLSKMDRISSFEGAVFAAYDWDKNRIVVSTLIVLDNVNDEICADWLYSVKQQLGVDPNTGKPYNHLSAVTQLFRDRGFLSGELRDLLTGHLDHITELKVNLVDNYNPDLANERRSCMSNLLEADVSFGK